MSVPTVTIYAIFVIHISTYNDGGMPVADLVASRHVTMWSGKKIGVNRRNIYNSIQVTLAAPVGLVFLLCVIDLPYGFAEHSASFDK